MNHWYVQVFLALGGMALVWKAAKEGIPAGVAVGMKWLLSHPSIKVAVVENKDKIEAILLSSEQEAVKAIEEASKEVPPAA